MCNDLHYHINTDSVWDIVSGYFEQQINTKYQFQFIQ